MIAFELFLIFIIVTTILVVLIGIFYKIQPYQPIFHKLKLTIIVFIFLSVSFYILNSLPNLYSESDVILTSETVVPSNLLFILLCISIYFFLKRLVFSESDTLKDSIEEDDEFKDQNDFNEDFAPNYEDYEANHNQDEIMTNPLWEEDDSSSLNEMKFKELNEYINELYEKQLKS